MRPRYVKTHRSRDIERSVLAVSSKILKVLKAPIQARFTDIFMKLGDKSKLKEQDFMLALNFLFILGVIAYDKKNDLIIYKK